MSGTVCRWQTDGNCSCKPSGVCPSAEGKAFVLLAAKVPSRTAVCCYVGVSTFDFLKFKFN